MDVLTPLQWSWLLQLMAGVMGGYVLAAAVPQLSLGLIGNAVLGAAGGALGAIALQEVYSITIGGGLKLIPVLANLASGGLGGMAGVLVLGLVVAITRGLIGRLWAGA